MNNASMNGRFNGASQFVRSELRKDTLDIVLTRLSGAVYRLEGLSDMDTIYALKAKVESLMENEMAATDVLCPSECYDVGLMLDENLLRDGVTLREAGLQTGDSVCILCRKGDRLQRDISRLVEAVAEKDLTRAGAILAQFLDNRDQQEFEKDRMDTIKQTLVAGLEWSLYDAVCKKDFAEASSIQSKLDVMHAQSEVTKDLGFEMKEALGIELTRLLDEAVGSQAFVWAADIQAALGYIGQEPDYRMEQKGRMKQALMGDLMLRLEDAVMKGDFVLVTKIEAVVGFVIEGADGQMNQWGGRKRSRGEDLHYLLRAAIDNKHSARVRTLPWFKRRVCGTTSVGRFGVSRKRWRSSGFGSTRGGG